MVFNSLKTRISQGEFKTGTKLPSERVLAAQYQVSRIPVREAVKMLEDSGFVTKISGVGAVICPIPEVPAAVPPPSADLTVSLLETVHVRRLIESEAARCAALHATNEGIERIRKALFENIAEMGKMKNKEKHNFFLTDRDFHRAIAAESGSAFLLQCLDSMPTLINLQQYWSIHFTPVKDEGIQYHTRIFEAILNHDPEEAYASMYDHMSLVEERIQKEGLAITSFTL